MGGVKGLKKLVFLLAGLIVIWTLLMMRGAVLGYSSCDVVLSSLVGLWNSIKCLLSSSLYICIIINSMVLLIAATSAFHRTHETTHDHYNTNHPVVYDHDHDHDNDHIVLIAKSSPPPPPIEEGVMTIASNESSAAVERANEEGDTMEATWKAITQRPIKKHLKKSETWRVLDSEPSIASSSKELRKSETFNETVRRSRGGLVRDPSIGLDEFHRQVEAFIQKFNDDMRLQRQESDQRFLDMIKRGL